MSCADHPRNRSQHIALLLVSVILVSVLLISLVSADESGLTRGSRFTITVTGTPNTPYYVWLTRTYTLSGEPGDQPPILLANQANIVKDPVDGPYVIGSYRFNNGGGRTILEDVAPSTASMSSTQYYAQVTTNSDGYALVSFQTSSNTATRTFSVKVESPQSAVNGNILVQRGDTGIKPGSVGFDTPPTTPVPSREPTPVILTLTETATPVPPTAIPVISTSPAPAATHRVPTGMWVCIAAVGAGLVALRKFP
jgi:hypothetical protein